MSLTAEDTIEIQNLINRYSFAFDRRDAETFAACFTPDGGFYLGQEEQARGRDALVSYVAATPAPGQLRHVVSSVLTDGDGAAATSQAYCTVFASSPGAGYQILAQGIYRDRLTKGSDGWRFTERRFDPDPA